MVIVRTEDVYLHIYLFFKGFNILQIYFVSTFCSFAGSTITILLKACQNHSYQSNFLALAGSTQVGIISQAFSKFEESTFVGDFGDFSSFDSYYWDDLIQICFYLQMYQVCPKQEKESCVLQVHRLLWLRVYYGSLSSLHFHSF